MSEATAVRDRRAETDVFEGWVFRLDCYASRCRDSGAFWTSGWDDGGFGGDAADGVGTLLERLRDGLLQTDMDRGSEFERFVGENASILVMLASYLRRASADIPANASNRDHDVAIALLGLAGELDAMKREWWAAMRVDEADPGPVAGALADASTTPEGVDIEAIREHIERGFLPATELTAAGHGVGSTALEDPIGSGPWLDGVSLIHLDMALLVVSRVFVELAGLEPLTTGHLFETPADRAKYRPSRLLDAADLQSLIVTELIQRAGDVGCGEDERVHPATGEVRRERVLTVMEARFAVDAGIERFRIAQNDA